MKIAIGGDHGSVEYKSAITNLLIEMGHIVNDFGTFTNESCDYSDFAYLAAKSVANKENDRAIVICSTGIGVSISANKVEGIRCALVTSTLQAKLTREHNNTNALALGVFNTDLSTALEITKIWIETNFSNDERHVRRISKIDALGKDYFLLNANQFVVGGSLKNSEYSESNNMAYYTTKNPKGVHENRKRLYHHLNQDLSKAVFPNQTHSNHVVKVTSKHFGKGSLSDQDAILDCDALYTFDKKVVLNVFHADCVPLWLYDPTTNLIAIAHNSVEATSKGLTTKLIETLIQEGINVNNLVCFIGAGISKYTIYDRKFDVDVEEVIHLASVVERQLKKFGIKNITKLNTNTDTDPQYFSHHLKENGRHISFIYRK